MIIKRYKPQLGDTKELHKFAWFPTRIDKEILVWLEWYWELKEYYERPSVWGVLKRTISYVDLHKNCTCEPYLKIWREKRIKT